MVLISSVRSSASADGQRQRRQCHPSLWTRLHAALVLLALSCGPMTAAAQDRQDDPFKQGYADYNAGDYGRAREHWRPLAEAGHAKAQYGLGLMYANGSGVPQDDLLASQWLRKAADQGHAPAQDALGTLYQLGRGVPKDELQAVRWYRRAAEQGLDTAQYNLARQYDFGRGVPRDLGAARKWYEKAADQGYPRAQYNLAVMYANGDGVIQDDARAMQLMRMAAAQGHRQATFSLGVMYAEGRGAPRNPATAFALISAVPSPDEQMAQYLDMLVTGMTSAQLAHAKQLAVELLSNGVSEETLRRMDSE